MPKEKNVELFSVLKDDTYRKSWESPELPFLTFFDNKVNIPVVDTLNIF